jgi:hypothetical protein
MMMYTVLLVEAYRVWKATHGEDEMDEEGMAVLTTYPIIFHCLWPLFNFNLFIWMFSLAFVFSLSFLPSPLLPPPCWHHVRVARPSRRSASPLGGSNPERQMEEDTSGMALIIPVLATLLLFSLSTLATSGAHVALHVYSGHNVGELIDELYRFQYDSFTHTPRFNMRIFDLDFAKALESLPTPFDLGSLPDLGWGPENFAQLARSQNTLTLLVSLIRCAIAVVFFALQACGFANPSISTAKAAGGRKMSMAVQSPMHSAKKEGSASAVTTGATMSTI